MKKIILLFLFCLSVQGLFAQAGTVLNFDGVDDRITLPSQINTQFPDQQMTLEAWIFVDDDNTNVSVNIVGEAELGNGTIGGVLFIENDKIKGGYFLYGYSFAMVEAPLTKEQWTHVALTIDRNVLKLYLNGILADNKQEIFDLPQGEDEWRIGQLWDADLFLEGSLDEIRIWNTVRTCAEINSHKDIELTGDEDGLVSYFNFNQGTAGANNSGVDFLTDLAGNYNGTLYNFALDGATSNWIDGSSNGVSGTSPTLLGKIRMTNHGITILNNDTEPTVYDSTFFGCTDDEIARTFYIHNDGAGVLNVSEIDFSGDPDFSFDVPSLPFAIAAGDSIGITILLAANPGAGSRAGDVTITSDVCDDREYLFSIGGSTGINPTLTLTASRTEVCSGELVTLTADGGNNYYWPAWPGSSSGDQDATVDQTTTYYITGKDNGCESMASVTVTASSCTSVLKPESEYASMYPNPFTNAFIIEVPGKTLDMMIYDSKGALVKKETVSNLATIDLTGTTAGLYKVMLFENGKSVYKTTMMMAGK